MCDADDVIVCDAPELDGMFDDPPALQPATARAAISGKVILSIEFTTVAPYA